jgi:hypothetical protein
MKKYRLPILIVAMAAVILALPLVASANHQWGSYKWESDGTPVTLTIGDNTGGLWTAHLGDAVLDWGVNGANGVNTAGQWTADSMLDLSVVTGNADQTNQNCTPETGNIEVCNDNYGNTGWLGIAGIWASRGKNKSITRGYTKVNDYYFDAAPYNTPDWRQMVMCQEVGHDFGLDHQDENFGNANLGTCMDYTSDPSTNTSPNQHDYDQLEAMYGGGDGGNGGNGGPPAGKGKPSFAAGQDHSEFGRAIGADASGRANVFELDLKNGEKLITHVLWAS